MLRAVGQPSASAISVPGFRYSHMPCGTEIDSIAPSSASEPASAAAARTASTISRYGSAHAVGILELLLLEADADDHRRVRRERPRHRHLLAGVDGLPLLGERLHALARVARAEDRAADLELPRERRRPRSSSRRPRAACA